jgi:hypothetical protein
MPGTRRTPIDRSRKPQITVAAIQLFKKMRYCRNENRWWQLHGALCDELATPAWAWPCIENPADGNPYPAGTANHTNWEPDEDARERWCALEQGARELRRREREARRAKSAVQ